jgi:tRNA(Ile)-lysidine synthase
MKSKLVKNFKNFIFQEKLFSGGESLIVGISGGADSVCLVVLLLAVQKKFDLELRLVHINYHLRGKNSDKDEEFVREFAEEKNLRLDVVDYREDIKSDTKMSIPSDDWGRKSKVVDCAGENKGQGKNDRWQAVFSNNLEERLRDFRYEVFERVRTENKAEWIVVAHHRGDQVETFLMNLFRGAGVEGLKGMQIKSEQRRILRPLLNFSKDDLKEFLKNIEQGWREDRSNEDNVFLRNKIRNKLIPEIESEYSLRFAERIEGITKQLQNNLKITERVVDAAYEDVVKEKDKLLLINAEMFLLLRGEVKALVFRRIVKKMKGDLKNISEGNYREFKKIMESKKGKRQKMKIGKLKFEKIGVVLKIKLV